MTDTSPSTAAPGGTYPGWFLTTELNVPVMLLIVVIMVLVNADEIGRGMFNSPISGAPEIVSMSIVAIVFLQIAHTFTGGHLTRYEAILGFVGERAREVRILMEQVFALAATALVWQVFAASLPVFRKSWVCRADGSVGAVRHGHAVSPVPPERRARMSPFGIGLLTPSFGI